MIHAICWSRSYSNPSWHSECAKILWPMRSGMNEKAGCRMGRMTVLFLGKQLQLTEACPSRKSKSSTDANWPGSKKTKWDALKTACVILACWVRGKLKNEGEKRQPRKNKIKLHNQKIPQSSTSLQFGSRYKAAFIICKHHMPKSSNKSSTLPKYSFFLANGVKTSS